MEDESKLEMVKVKEEIIERPLLHYSESESLQKEILLAYNSYEQQKQDAPCTVNVLIPAVYLKLGNKNIKFRNLYGSDTYSSDSDVFAAIVHQGFFAPKQSLPHPALNALEVQLQLKSAASAYISTLRFNLRSRPRLPSPHSIDFSVSSCTFIKRDGSRLLVTAAPQESEKAVPTLARHGFSLVELRKTTNLKQKRHSSHSKQKARRKTAATSRKGGTEEKSDIFFSYNLCNEPWPAYAVDEVADAGLAPEQLTSTRLRRGHVLYLESLAFRYELSCQQLHCQPEPGFFDSSDSEGGEAASHSNDAEASSCRTPQGSCSDVATARRLGSGLFRWAVCRQALGARDMAARGVPLPAADRTVIEEGLRWEEIEWNARGVRVRGKLYGLLRARFFKDSAAGAKQEAP